jgi:hypothetical protein
VELDLSQNPMGELPPSLRILTFSYNRLAAISLASERLVRLTRRGSTRLTFLF